MSWFRVSALVALCWLRPAPALAQAADPADLEGAQSLLSDVARVVAAEEVDDWFSDVDAMQSIEQHLLPSACRATAEARTTALSMLAKRRTDLGDPREIYARRSELTSEARVALTADREYRALSATLGRAAECPFWIGPTPGFQGLQSDRHRLTLSLESGGNVQFRYADRRWTLGAGGGGRLLVGWGFDGRYSLLFGPELGGSALLRPGSNASEFVINYFPALPLVFRSRQLTWHYELETAPVAVFQADNTRLSYGVRVGGAFAVAALRRRNVLPWAGLALAYEYYPEGAGRGATHFFRGGVRVGLPWDP